MSSNYIYSLSADFQNGVVDISLLQQEIDTNNIINKNILGITVDADDVTIIFSNPLEDEELDELDVIVENHDGSNNSNNIITNSELVNIINITNDSTVSDGGVGWIRYQDANDTGTGFTNNETPLNEGTVQNYSITGIAFENTASNIDDEYIGYWVKITNNVPTGVQNQIRKIIDYDGSIREATIETPWTVTPNNNSTYAIYNKRIVGLFYDETLKRFDLAYLKDQRTINYSPEDMVDHADICLKTIYIRGDIIPLELSNLGSNSNRFQNLYIENIDVTGTVDGRDISIDGANLDSHISDLNNPHQVTKAQLGLSEVQNVKHNLTAVTSPTVNNDVNEGYQEGSTWIDTLGNQAWVCVDSTLDNAVWLQTTVQPGGGEANTASNVGFGDVWFKQKVGTDLQFKTLMTDGTIAVEVNDDDIELSVDTFNINHDEISGTGVFSHSQIDSAINTFQDHLIDFTNPHNVTKAQLGLSEVQNIKHYLNGASAPNNFNDSNEGFQAGSIWVDILNKQAYICTDATISSAIWKKTTVNAIGINLGTGYDVYKQSNNSTLQFRSLKPQTSALVISETTNELQIDIDPSSLNHDQLQGSGSNTHSQIDAHIASTNNPHNITKAQLGLSEVQNVKHNLGALGPPSSSNDSSQGYQVGSMWVVNNNAGYVCLDASVSNAIWIKTTTQGETNTASNIGTGLEILYQKNGENFEFRNLRAGNHVSLSYDAPNRDIVFDFNPIGMSHNDLMDTGSYTHTQIDSHINSVNNPHQVTKYQIGLSEVQNIKHNYAGIFAPTVAQGANNGYQIGSIWIDIVNDKAYICVDPTNDASIWKELTFSNNGEANTVINLGVGGGGTGLFAQKVNSELQFKSIKAETGLNLVENLESINLSVNPGQIQHQNLLGAGSNTHAQIDTAILNSQNHIANSSNPHSVTKTQIGLSEVQNIKNKYNAVVNPTISDGINSGYAIGSIWVNVVSDQAWMCVDASVSNAIWLELTTQPGSGESNDVINVGTGLSVFKQKIGTNLVFKTMIGGSGITITDNGDDLTINADSNVISHNDLQDIGVYTHDEIDDHIEDIDNPHQVTKDQVGLSEVQNIKNNLLALTSPVATNDSSEGYQEGSIWINTSNDKAWVCVDSTDNSAVWVEMTVTESGEVATMTNIGITGVGIYKEKSGNEFRLKKLHSTNNDLLIQDDTINNQLNFSLIPGNINHQSLDNAGILTHTELDDHVSSRSNPHEVSLDQITPTSIKGDIIVETGIGATALPVGSNGQILKADSTAIEGVRWVDPSGIVAGENNTASNVGVAGVGLFKQKVSENLEFKKIFSNTLSVTNNVGQSQVDIDVVPGNIDHSQLLNSGTNTHTQIDNHITSTNNPHSVTINQVSPLGNKGSIIVYDGSDNIEFQSGSNTQILQADSLEPSGLKWVNSSTIGEFTTASNEGSGGIGLFKQKTLENLEFRNINSITNAITLTLDSVNNKVDLNLVQSNIDHDNLLNSGINSHAQIDSHLSNTSNPHNVTFEQLTPTTTKGDLIVDDGSSNVRLSVGTNGQFLQADSTQITGLKWVDSSTIGEITTVSNEGLGGVGLFKQKTGSNLEFRNINSSTNAITVSLDAINDEVDLNLIQENIDHSNLLNVGTNTHAQIDSHIANQSNPHNVTLNQIAPTTTKGDIIVYNGSNNVKLSAGSQNQLLQVDSTQSTGLKWVDPSTVGEFTTGSNVGLGAGIFKQKTGSNLEFKSLTTNNLTITNNANSINVDLDSSIIDHSDLLNSGINTHAQIDTAITNSQNHIANLNNPHSVTIDQVSPLDTKGDIIVYNGTNNVKLSVGSNGQRLQADSTQSTGLKWVNDDVITASNVGTLTVGIFKQKVVSDLQFKGLTSLSTALDITDDIANNRITFDIDSTEIDHANLQNIGIYTHSQIDDHITDTENPHSVTIDQISPTLNKGDILVEDGTQIVRFGVGTDNQILQADSLETTGLKWVDPSTIGEINTGGNIGVSGIGIFAQKTGTILEFKKIDSASNKVTVVEESNRIKINVDEAQIVHQNLSGSGTNTHAQIDIAISNSESHIANLNNPHSVTIDQISPLNTKGDIIVYDGSSSSRLAVGTQSQILQVDSGEISGLKWVDSTTVGEFVTASNVGVGSGFFKQKTGSNLEFKKIQNGSHITKVENADNIVLDVLVSAIDHSNLLNSGTNTHAQIDAHIANTSNPHNVTFAQISPITNKGDIITRNSITETRLAVGTNGQFLKADSSEATGLKWFNPLPLVSTVDAIAKYTDTSGSIKNSSLLLSDVNATIQKTIQLSINDTNTSFIIKPTGLGALLTAKPDNLTTGGALRGNNAVDLQMYRLNASDVASGNYSVLIGGQGNKADGDYSFAMGRRAKANHLGSMVLTDSTNSDFTSLSNDELSMRFSKVRIKNTSGNEIQFQNGKMSIDEINSSSNLTLNPTGEVLLSNDPSSPLGAVTKQYVDALNFGITVKDSVRVKTASSLPAYTRTGNVITANVNGLLPTIDGVIMQVGDRVLVDSEGSQSDVDNGLYTITQVGIVILQPWILTRTTDADEDAEVTSGMYVFVEEGNTYGSSGFVLTSQNPITVNTTELIFKRLSNPIDTTASNVGSGGIGVFKQKLGSNLEFYNINSSTNAITVSLDSENNEIDLNLTPININHQDLSGTGSNTHVQIDSHIADTGIHFEQTDIDHLNLLNSGTNTHTQIDTHIASINNPHSVTINQVTPTTTKGDLMVENGTSVVRLPVGSNTQVLQADPTQSTGLKWVDSDTIGENLTGANVSTNGVGTFVSKVSSTLNFRRIRGTSTIDVTNNPNNEIEIDVISSGIDHSDLLNSGTNTHAQIDSHIASTNNPHSVTIDQVSPLVNKGDLLSHNGTANVRLPIGSNTQLLQADSTQVTGLKWIDVSSVGEIITASNVGTGGIGLFKQKNLQNLEFRNINSTSTALTVTLDSANNEIDLGLVQGNIDHTVLLNSGVNTHVQIDAHIANSSNPHSVTIDQISPVLTKGDLLVRNNTQISRLASGTNGQVLQVDSTEVTGLKWSSTIGGTNKKMICNLTNKDIQLNNTNSWRNVGRFLWINDRHSGFENCAITFYAEITNRNIEFQVWNRTTSNSLGTFTTSGENFYIFSFIKPTANARLEIQARKTSNGGNKPTISNLQIEMDF